MEKPTDRTDTLDQLQRELAEGLSRAVIGSATSVKEFFDAHATTIVLASLGITNNYGRIEVCRSNAFMSAFTDAITDMTQSRAAALVKEHATSILDDLHQRGDALSKNLVEMAITEYERGLQEHIFTELRRAEDAMADQMVRELTEEVKARVASLTPDYVNKLRATLTKAVMGGKSDI